MERIFVATIGIALLSTVAGGQTVAAERPDMLQLETKIPLGQVVGRIDHMAIDPTRHRLFVAELGNDTVRVVDLDQNKVIHLIIGLREPQGVGYVPSSDMLYVTSGADGSVRLFEGENYAVADRIDLGNDADNIRVDVAANRVFIGYGSGAIAIIDPANRSKIADIALKAHPEGFQLDDGGIFINVPAAREIAVVDRATGKQTASWTMTDAGGNFPLALDKGAQRIFVVFRAPAKLGVFSMQNGAAIATVETCADADDVFVDERRHHLYVSCGDGFLDVFGTQGDAYQRLAHIPTISGARTSLFDPDMDRLLLAVRARSGEPAAIWIFRPTP